MAAVYNFAKIGSSDFIWWDLQFVVLSPCVLSFKTETQFISQSVEILEIDGMIILSTDALLRF